jgi:hypothetical protein
MADEMRLCYRVRLDRNGCTILAHAGDDEGFPAHLEGGVTEPVDQFVDLGKLRNDLPQCRQKLLAFGRLQLPLVHHASS